MQNLKLVNLNPSDFDLKVRKMVKKPLKAKTMELNYISWELFKIRNKIDKKELKIYKN